jgi:hypothetical protein
VDFEMTEITEALQDWFKDEISAAYQQGAEDVHNAWIVGNGQSEADFGEAASDYAASRNTQSTAPLIAANEALKERVAELEAFIANPPKHKFWMPGEPDCPRELKAGNGELHTLRCKVCGDEGGLNDICRADTVNSKGPRHDRS